ncbi:phage terminase large subunit family protein [Asaia bogorensis]
MEALDELRFLNVAVVGPARSGKTTIGQNWILKSVDVDPADFLVYAQTDDMIESYVKREIAPMIDLHPQVKEKLGLRPVDNSLKFERFLAMWIEFLAAAYNNLINKSAPRIIMTEIDAYPANLGDPCAFASIRRETLGQKSMLLAESHPDRANGHAAGGSITSLSSAFGDL